MEYVLEGKLWFYLSFFSKKNINFFGILNIMIYVCLEEFYKQEKR